MKYKKYPSYKDSGVEWLGDIPIHWNKQSIKTLMNLHKGINKEKNPIVLSVTLSGIKIKDIESGKGQLSDSYENYNPVTPNHIVFNPMDLISGFVGKPPINGVVSPAYTSITLSKKCYIDFYVYLFQKFYHERILFPYGKGVSFDHRWTINNETFFGLSTLFPPYKEQQQIANFLDKATAKIDTLIEKQTKQIELLKEKRQAVISHAVTKGINPNVPMKDSGVEWLGEIPEHWIRTKIKNKLSKPITDGPHETPQFFDEGVPFISAEAISSGVINFNKKRGCITEEQNIIYSRKYTPKKFDVYMIKSGATTGVCAIVETDIKFNIWSPLAVFRSGIDLNPFYLLNFLRSNNFQTAVQLNWSFGTQQNIGMNVLENLFICIPPFKEQIEIVNYIYDKTSKIDTLIEKSNKSIELLKEKRTALISAAVTGKIDVRKEV